MDKSFQTVRTVGVNQIRSWAQLDVHNFCFHAGYRLALRAVFASGFLVAQLCGVDGTIPSLNLSHSHKFFTFSFSRITCFCKRLRQVVLGQEWLGEGGC